MSLAQIRPSPVTDDLTTVSKGILSVAERLGMDDRPKKQWKKGR
jgi:hypothetical protein